MEKKFRDITVGDIFTRWTVIGNEFTNEKYPKILCRCECGIEKYINAHNLIRGQSKSCGCLVKDTNETHGIYGTVEWITYHGMLARCYNESSKVYTDYGGRGIKVCDRWLEPDGVGLMNFVKDMGERPDNTSLDRIDVNSGYSPENCRWTSKSMQAFNRRKTDKNTSGRQGVFWRKGSGKWIVKFTIDGKEVWVGTYKLFEDAVAAAEQAELDLRGQIREN